VKITPQCVPCLLRRAIYEAELSGPEKVPAAIRAACAVFARAYRPGAVSAVLATKVHAAVYRALRDPDPYRDVKRRSNEVATGLLPAAKRYVGRSKDRLRAAILCSIAGNMLDFGIRSDMQRPEDLRQAFSGILREGLSVDDTPRLRRLLRHGAKVVYLADNCGEIVFDRLVFRELRRLGASVALVVRGAPILTDATIEDVEELGLRPEVDLVLETGSFAVGVDLGRMPAALRRALRECDVIISKGMANFESFSGTGWRPMIHLMRTKCGPVASAAGAPMDVSIAKLWA
jgi:uncharacterized protein with ATP-grasp and redox domains